MTAERTVKSIGGLMAARQGRIDRLTTEVANRQSTCSRYREQIDAIDRLRADAAKKADRSLPALAVNCAGYQHSMATLALEHRRLLALQEADLQAARRRLTELVLQRERWQKALELRRGALVRQQNVREQKRQDEMASQSWLRSRH
ncbi:flagellar FliJ family protein [Trinickia mobilis]|uniref:flagellar FliJ family protein n=1 Tax=Trinickia mobilis TaxID=2816356 RepID=UPI001A90AD06|nr:flagellar FliJ family protein [Trinickia mobilis]